MAEDTLRHENLLPLGDHLRVRPDTSRNMGIGIGRWDRRVLMGVIPGLRGAAGHLLGFGIPDPETARPGDSNQCRRDEHCAGQSSSVHRSLLLGRWMTPERMTRGLEPGPPLGTST